jgi:hypothetical protein
VLGRWGEGLKGCLGESERVERCRKVPKGVEKCRKVPKSGGKCRKVVESVQKRSKISKKYRKVAVETFVEACLMGMLGGWRASWGSPDLRQRRKGRSEREKKYDLRG